MIEELITKIYKDEGNNVKKKDLRSIIKKNTIEVNQPDENDIE